MQLKFLFTFATAFLLGTVVVQGQQRTDIVDTAIANGNFKTLVIALQAAGLVDTLKSPGPFTVFAPTDAAFAKLPAGTIPNLLKPENKPILIQLLTYHVVAGNLTAEAIIDLKPPVKVATLDGFSFLVTLKGNKLKVDNATVIIPNVFATNGIIHAIDEVIFPPTFLSNIVQTANATGDFTTLLKALQAASLVETLEGPGPFTVFAPTDAAFAKLPPRFLEFLLEPRNKGLLTEILEYHVVGQKLTAADIVNLPQPRTIKTVNSFTIYVEVQGSAVRLDNEANVIKADVLATNGIIHVIDFILIPRRFSKFLTSF